MTFQVGQIYLLIMIKKNFLESSKHLNVSNQIPMYLLLSVLEVHTQVHVLQSRCLHLHLEQIRNTLKLYLQVIIYPQVIQKNYLIIYKEKIFQLTLFQNQVLRQNQQLHLDYLNNWLKKNMEKMKLRNVFLQRQINLKVHLNNQQTMRVMKRLLYLMMWEVVILFLQLQDYYQLQLQVSILNQS